MERFTSLQLEGLEAPNFNRAEHQKSFPAFTGLQTNPGSTHTRQRTDRHPSRHLRQSLSCCVLWCELWHAFVFLYKQVSILRTEKALTHQHCMPCTFLGSVTRTYISLWPRKTSRAEDAGCWGSADRSPASPQLSGARRAGSPEPRGLAPPSPKTDEQAPEPTPTPCSSAAPRHVCAGSPARAATRDTGPSVGKTKLFKYVNEEKVS